jgi:hypothetical protein
LKPPSCKKLEFLGGREYDRGQETPHALPPSFAAKARGAFYFLAGSFFPAKEALPNFLNDESVERFLDVLPSESYGSMTEFEKWDSAFRNPSINGTWRNPVMLCYVPLTRKRIDPGKRKRLLTGFE